MNKNVILSKFKYIFLYIYSTIIIFPLLFILVSSLKDNEDIFINPWGLPKVYHWDTYLQLFKKYGMGIYFLNSLYYSILGCIISIIVCTAAAYAISRLKWKLSGITMGFLLLGLMIPAHSTIIPLFYLSSKIGLKNPKISLILIFVAFSIPTTVYILAGFMKSIPREMEESAVIDGSSIIGAFIKIITPLLKTPIATVTIFTFLGIWNDLLFSLVFINKETDKNVQLGIMKFLGSYGSRYGILLSAVVVSMLPAILVYIILQDKIVDGLTAGAVKG